MKLLINHQTTYRYDRPVKRSVQYLRMTPQTYGHQRVLNWRLAAAGRLYTQPDGFGNAWSTLTLTTRHQDLLIMAQGEIDIDEDGLSVRDDRIPAELFTCHTELTQPDDAIRAFSHQHLRQHTRAGLIALAQALGEAMPYTSGTTNVLTSARESFALGRGVCQDHTHVFLSCVREQNLPARYVSGYLYTNSATHLASHAWAEVLLDGEWYCFDVSNQLFRPCQHVQIAIGRDYLDAAPVRGMRQGGGLEAMSALVQVMRAPA
jgi:transglutaminase-like putative cysteine protease